MYHASLIFTNSNRLKDTINPLHLQSSVSAAQGGELGIKQEDLPSHSPLLLHLLMLVGGGELAGGLLRHRGGLLHARHGGRLLSKG